jgi:anti-sigma regulatory factor (Ser/Thr protein kinase)
MPAPDLGRRFETEDAGMTMVSDVATIQMRFERDPRSAGHARRAVQDCLDGTVPTQTMGTAVLLTSELVTNAVTHTLSAGELFGHYDQVHRRLWIEVHDNSPVLPDLQDGVNARLAGGFGLRLVDLLASSWGAIAAEPGKTVWFELKW